MTSIYDIYKIIHNFLVIKTTLDSDNIIINYENGDIPSGDYIGLYIEKIEQYSNYEYDVDEDGNLIQETIQEVPVMIDFYGGLSELALEIQAKLNMNTWRSDLEIEGLTISEIGSVDNLSKQLQEEEFLERYQLRVIFQLVNTATDTTTSDEIIDDVQIDVTIETDGNAQTPELCILDNIVIIEEI